MILPIRVVVVVAMVVAITMKQLEDPWIVLGVLRRLVVPLDLLHTLLEQAVHSFVEWLFR